MNSYGLILAGGKGTRMNDVLPKVAQKILGKEFINFVYDALSDAGIQNIYPIVGYKKDIVLACRDFDTHFVQEEQLGTGHAVQMAYDELYDKEGLCFVIAGDQPLITSESIKSVINAHIANENDLTLLTAERPNPYGYGRIIRNGNEVVRIVEETDCTEEEKLINEVNISTFCFDNKKLFNYIKQLKFENAQEELYLTDVLEIFKKEKLRVEAIKALTYEETVGISNKKDLAIATDFLKKEINNKHMDNGVTLIDPNNTYIGPDVTIGKGAIVYPGSVIEGSVSIGENCLIQSSYIIDSNIGDNVTVGPFAHIRQNSELGNNIRVGNFVEIKKSQLADGVKAAHLTYLGDSEIENKVNIGCGTITVNYDGKNKHKTLIGEGAFIGSNVNLIAPINIGKNSIIAAGSTITKDVPADALAIARERETIKTEYNKK
ncbi:bifunctional UDP-N-acetylglucosamine diphosphorylase/glucosamine-1-phosphate N-acetyltransferase GlmU [Mycoplasmatota bacterium]|nr:bifunctional UDP-N-acetylglucosamine diphosphorylase/glucosamine-1-phosphate N-acetyltransferase GlmU [Mycoplasmatota bacterium]